jgi:hypothetical protein
MKEPIISRIPDVGGEKSDVHLTDEQVAEVRRRLSELNPKTLTLSEFSERLRRRYGV